MNRHRTVGIIGFGQFGQLLPTILPANRKVFVHDKADRRREAAQHDCTLSDFETACACDVVVFATPVQQLQEVIAKAAPLVRPDAWVLEVSSVKVLPSQWMASGLPDGVSITCVHPLFGPQSARIGLAGRRLVICPIRGERHTALARLAGRHGLVVRMTDPNTHDKEMAHVQALTHLIAKAIVATGRPRLTLQTQPYLHLMDLCGLIEHDSEELFNAIQTLNPHAGAVVDAFCDNVTGIGALLRARRKAN